MTARARVRKKKPILLNASEIGLPAITQRESDAGRMWFLDALGVTRFVRSRYLDAFYRTCDREYGAFAALPYADEAKTAIARRVAASIRTIAAFSAWYTIVWRFIGAGFVVAIAVAAALAVVAAASVPAARANPVAMAGGIVAALAVLTLTALVFTKLQRLWPFDVIALVVVSAGLGTLAQFVFTSRSDAWWAPAAVGALIAVTALSTASAVVLLVTQAWSQYITWSKISAYPEEEIIQTTAVVLTRLQAAGAAGWRIPEIRARAAQNLEWIARRFEQNYANRFLSGDPGGDAVVSAEALAIAAAFRRRERELVFPGASSLFAVTSFLWDALSNEAAGTWGALDRATPTPKTERGRARLVDGVRSALAIAVPALIAIGALFVHDLSPEWAALQRNVVITGLSWSVLSFLAVLNPRQFEQQASAAKTFGDLFKKGAG